ncbi:MAG: hypothetical protein ACJAUL_003068 [Paraglaciecola sp.]|jgi:hypothetical protein
MISGQGKQAVNPGAKYDYLAPIGSVAKRTLALLSTQLHTTRYKLTIITIITGQQENGLFVGGQRQL